MLRRLVGPLVLLSLPALHALGAPPDPVCPDPAHADQIFEETFSKGSNDGQWSYGSSTEFIDRTGGGHGAFLHARGMEVPYPIVQTLMGADSSFTGDWRGRGIDAFAVDLVTYRADFWEGRYVSLVLINDSGTPESIDDDCIVFFTSDRNAPAPSAGKTWEHYRFDIPSADLSLPQPNSGVHCAPGEYCETCPELGVPCWGVFQGSTCPTREDYDATWNAVIQDVDQVRISYQHPEYVSLFGLWNTGIDDVAVAACSR